MAEEKHRINKLKLDKVPPSFMSFEDLLLPIVISLVIGFILRFFDVKTQIVAIEDKFREELERWKVESAGEIGIDSPKYSSSALKGKM